MYRGWQLTEQCTTKGVIGFVLTQEGKGRFTARPQAVPNFSRK